MVEPIPSGWTIARILILAFAAAACGGSEPTEAAPEPEQSQGAEREAEGEPMAVTGLMGTIPERKIQRVLEGRLGRFQRCFFDGMETVEFLGGAVEFYFRVEHSGAVESVYLRNSTVGHRGTERCLLERASEASFPAPQGGDAAEFAWGFELDPPDGVRPPVPWQVAQLEPVRAPIASLLGECGVGEATITAYVSPGGALLSAGVAAQDAAEASALDCVVSGLSGLAWPDPGSYAAKVTFAAP